MSMVCEDCGEEPALPGQKVCGYCSDYADYRASVARQNQRAQLAALDRELGPGGLAGRHLPLEPPVEERLVLPPLVAWRTELLQEVGHPALRALVPKRARGFSHRNRTSNQVVVQRHVEAVAVARRTLQTSQASRSA